MVSYNDFIKFIVFLIKNVRNILEFHVNKNSSPFCMVVYLIVDGVTPDFPNDL